MSFRRCVLMVRCIRCIMPPVKTYYRACFALAKYADSKFCLGKRCHHKFCLGNRCQRLPSANHICVRKRLITKFRYQLVFFTRIYGWLKVAFGICCLGKTCGGIFCLGKTCHRHLLPGSMLHLLQHVCFTACMFAVRTLQCLITTTTHTVLIKIICAGGNLPNF